ncbi:hypothetical protein CSB45_06545 [candidate division KSB3 bacterium]|uniref:LysM domain-containing protein n=1 Tax=candidate division KSB3 bacterium TaxID=2044937 RepID=A0A2G6E7X0_9BACT|nr:MAG: hypothetical protein CSB45_06545 [candidate division KSB3 bacterium]PIE30298.1 MAG: hypothetical protein CSA57_05260 [candidate division KSB3 bacterium]
MGSRNDSRQRRRIFSHLRTWGGFALVLIVFTGYTCLLKEKEQRGQELRWGELQHLRQENHAFANRIHELEQQCAAPARNAEALQANPSAAPGKDGSETDQATERSFVYEVKRGDTIWDIAAMYQVEVKSLMRWNKLTPRSRIFPGDQLTIILEE